MDRVRELLAAVVLAVLNVPSQVKGQTVVQVHPRNIVKSGEVSTRSDAARKTFVYSVAISVNALETEKRVPVRSPVAGVVTFSGGNFGAITIHDASGLSHRLLHVDINKEMARVGESVKPGQVVGYMGRIGAGRDHVQYQIRDGNQQPMRVLPRKCEDIESFNDLFFTPLDFTCEDLDKRLTALDDRREPSVGGGGGAGPGDPGQPCGQFSCGAYWA